MTYATTFLFSHFCMIVEDSIVMFCKFEKIRRPPDLKILTERHVPDFERDNKKVETIV